MNKIDYKKEYKELYLPKTEPSEILVPDMNFIMIDGKGDPNLQGVEYEKAVELLYTLTFTIKMSVKSGREPKGYFEYVVPPLEGLWWMEEDSLRDFTRKDQYFWTSMIRQPEFVTEEVFRWACGEVSRKKPDLDTGKARFKAFEEGLCVQLLHVGPYDKEPQSIARIDAYRIEHDLKDDITAVLPDGNVRRHHEIYLSDPRKTKPESLKTVLRHPVRK
jgi:hypothetical protein